MPKPNYLFNYSLKNKKVTGTNIPTKSIDEIRTFMPSQITNEETSFPWIKIVNDKYSRREMKNAKPGKWILQFPAGDANLDKCWSELVDEVVNGELWEVKVSRKSDEFPNQVICIYTFHTSDMGDIERVYDLLDRKGFVQLHLTQPANDNQLRYKSDLQTMQNKNQSLYTQDDILAIKQQRQQREQKLKHAVQAISNLYAEFSDLTRSTQTEMACFAFFHRSAYSDETLTRVNELKQELVNTVQALPASLRKDEAIRKLLHPDQPNLIDFHRAKFGLLRIGNTHTRKLIDDLLVGKLTAESTKPKRLT